MHQRHAGSFAIARMFRSLPLLCILPVCVSSVSCGLLIVVRVGTQQAAGVSRPHTSALCPDKRLISLGLLRSCRLWKLTILLTVLVWGLVGVG